MTTKLKPLILLPHEVRNALKNGGGQFRRVVKPQHRNPKARTFRWENTNAEEILRCYRSPFGQPGDRVTKLNHHLVNREVAGVLDLHAVLVERHD